MTKNKEILEQTIPIMEREMMKGIEMMPTILVREAIKLTREAERKRILDIINMFFGKQLGIRSYDSLWLKFEELKKEIEK